MQLIPGPTKGHDHLGNLLQEPHSEVHNSTSCKPSLPLPLHTYNSCRPRLICMHSRLNEISTKALHICLITLMLYLLSWESLDSAAFCAAFPTLKCRPPPKSLEGIQSGEVVASVECGLQKHSSTRRANARDSSSEIAAGWAGAHDGRFIGSHQRERPFFGLPGRHSRPALQPESLGLDEQIRSVG